MFNAIVFELVFFIGEGDGRRDSKESIKWINIFEKRTLRRETGLR